MKQLNKVLAILLAIAMITTIFGSDLGSVAAYAVEDEEELAELQSRDITTAEWEKVTEDVQQEEYIEETPQEEFVEEYVEETQQEEQPVAESEEGSDAAATDAASVEATVESVDEAAIESSEDAGAAEGSEDAASESSSDEAEAAASTSISEDEAASEATSKTEEKLVTVTYKATKGGRVSLSKETVDVNDENAEFEGSIAEVWSDDYQFTYWTDADGNQVSTDSSFVPSDIEEDATFTANFVAVENIEEKMPAIEANDVHTGGLIVSVQAESGLFPAGTEIVIQAISDDAALSTAQDTLGENIKTAKGVDITFIYEGSEVQPADNKYVHVSLALEEAIEGDNFTVLHDHGGDVDVIDANISTDSDGNAEVASFDANQFSVFIVAGDGTSEDDTDDEKAVHTYNFYVGDELFNSQMVKMGETLYNPGIPSLGTNQEFNGWYTKNDAGEYDEAIAFGEVGIEVPVIDAEGVTNVYAYITTTYYVTFIGQNGEVVQVKRVAVSDGESAEVSISDDESAEVSISDVTITPNGSMEVFAGWAVSETDAEAGTVIESETVDASDDTYRILYATVVKAYWVYFNENDDNTGSASYTAPVYAKSGEKVQAPTAPTRKGYEFGGWYTSSACNDGEEFDFANIAITEDTTVYAKWSVNEETTFTVVVWKQKINDKKDATSKTYDYEASYEDITGKTGKAATKDMLVDSDGNDLTALSYTGFYYSSFDDDVELAADGSSIVNVYYDRKLMTVKFLDGKTGDEAHSDFTGLYGQTLSQNGYKWSDVDDDESYWYTRESEKDLDGEVLTILDAFLFDGIDSTKVKTNEKTEILSVYKFSKAKIFEGYFYQEMLDDDTSETSDVEINKDIKGIGQVEVINGKRYKLVDKINLSAGDFNITDKYTGFEAAGYDRYVPVYTEKETLKNWEWEGYQDAKAGDSIDNKYAFKIYYNRLSYSITFMNGNAKVSADESFDAIPYEKNISGYEELAPKLDNTDSEIFIGWFEDPSGQKEFEWDTTMPAANKVVYAYFAPIRIVVHLDADGGTLPEGLEEEFIRDYGTTLTKATLVQTTKEGYELIGWYEGSAPYSYGKLTGGTSEVRYDEKYEAYVKDVYLVAKWRNPGLINIVYDACANGTNAPSDKYGYEKDSSVVVAAPPTPNDGYTFLGWTIGVEGEGRLYFPNNSFNIKDYESYIVTNGNTKSLTIYAYYEKTGGNGTSTEVTTITYTANGGVGDDVVVGIDGSLKKNQAVIALTNDETGFTRTGYVFVGWGKTADATTPWIVGGEKIAADNNGYPEANILYAIWRLIDVPSEDEDTPSNPSDGTTTTTSDDPTPDTPSTPVAEQAVLGARRETTTEGQAVLGARRAKTEDETNDTARMIVIIASAAAAIALLFVGKKKKEDEQ